VTKVTDELGELGERIAARWLERGGWRILARRFRSGRRDIDLVVQRDELIVFVEVKARTGIEFGDPVEAVNHRKQRELAKSARTWVDRHGRSGESYRFDVMGILLQEGRVLVRHVVGAFELALRASCRITIAFNALSALLITYFRPFCDVRFARPHHPALRIEFLALFGLLRILFGIRR
jgi:putative endonuclease